VRHGELLSVMGPSGSGKSTLLHLIGALDRPTEGQIFIRGQDLTTVKNLDRFRNEEVGFVFQLHNLIPSLTARENIEVPMMGQPINRSERRERAKELLGIVGLEDRMGHLPNQLSGGERQRVAIARSLVNRPVLVLADEPTGNLDSQSGAEVIGLMRQINRDLGTTFVVVSHDPAVARQADRVLVMRDGNIAHRHIVGTPFEEDLATFRRSELGRAILAGDRAVSETLSQEEQSSLRRVLERVAKGNA